MSSLIEKLRSDREIAMSRLEELLPTDNDGNAVNAQDAPEWTEETQAEYDKIVASVGKIDARLKAFRKKEQLDSDNVDPIVQSEKVAEARAESTILSVDELTAMSLRNKEAFFAWAKTGLIDGVSTSDLVASGIQRPVMVDAPLNTGTNSQGGFLVPDEFSSALIERLLHYGGVFEVVDTETVSDGRDRKYPATNATSEVGELLAEGANSTVDDATFDQITLAQEVIGSKELRLSWELIQDSGIGILDHVAARLSTRIGRFANDLLTNGNSGTSKVFGIIEGATNGATEASGNTTSFTYGKLVELVHSVNYAYRQLNPVFMMSDAAVGAIQQIVDGNSRPIWTPSLAEGQPDRILGRPIIVNEHVPTPAAEANSILFGSFGFYKVLISRQTELYRLEGDAHVRQRRTGFLAYSRMAARMLDNSGGAVKYLSNSAD